MKERPPALAHLRFAERRAELENLGHQALFTEIYRSNLWGGEESRSGLGSAQGETARLREEIPRLLRTLRIGTVLDIPCGDFGWMSRVELGPVRYIGADIVAEIVERNAAGFGRPDGSIRFLRLDLLRDRLPEAALVLCRDCLVHFSNANIFAAFGNIRRSSARYLLTTTFPEHTANEDAADGDWRLLNLECPPFSLPPPQALLVEGCTEGGGAYADKSLGLWAVDELPRSS